MVRKYGEGQQRDNAHGEGGMGQAAGAPSSLSPIWRVGFTEKEGRAMVPLVQLTRHETSMLSVYFKVFRLVNGALVFRSQQIHARR